jgi:ERCC4-type nuclease
MIIIDHREKTAGIGRILNEKYSIPIQYGQLKTADYIISGNIAVERKTTADFIQSIIDARLFRQCRRLKNNFDYHCIIVEGTSIFHTQSKMHRNAIRGAFITLASSWHIPVVRTRDTEDTAPENELRAIKGDRKKHSADDAKSHLLHVSVNKEIDIVNVTLCLLQAPATGQKTLTAGRGLSGSDIRISKSRADV